MRFEFKDVQFMSTAQLGFNRVICMGLALYLPLNSIPSSAQQPHPACSRRPFTCRGLPHQSNHIVPTPPLDPVTPRVFHTPASSPVMGRRIEMCGGVRNQGLLRLLCLLQITWQRVL